MNKKIKKVIVAISVVAVALLIGILLSWIAIFIGEQEVISNDAVEELKNSTLNLSRENLESLGYQDTSALMTLMTKFIEIPDESISGHIIVEIRDDEKELSEVAVTKVTRIKNRTRDCHMYDLYIHCDSAEISVHFRAPYGKRCNIEEYICELVN